MRCEFHCHSNYSNDSIVTLSEIIDSCKENHIDAVFLTDHNEIDGAIKLKSIAPVWLTVVVGEEIKTKAGEIIGLFLKEKIESGMTLEKTVMEIKQQGGICVLPHPFDRLRMEKIDDRIILDNSHFFDVVEAFNGRTFFTTDDKKALEFAKQKRIPFIFGSDAHLIQEYGKVIVDNIECENPEKFIASLTNANFIHKKIPFYFHLISKYHKWKKKLTK